MFVNNNLLTTTSPGNFELSQSATLGDTYTFTPNLFNSLHLSFNRIRDNRGPTDQPVSRTALGSEMYSAVPNFLLIFRHDGRVYYELWHVRAGPFQFQRVPGGR